MSELYDVVVVGLGAMGSAAVHHLARSGQRVLGLDRFPPPHDRGSSHGQTRIIREAYFEDPAYVPLLRRAYELWFELEKEAGTALLRTTGGLMIGAADSEVVTGALRSAREHGLPHEFLEARDIRARFPALRPADDMAGVLEPRAGMLFPEECIRAHLAMAQRAGAALRYDEPVLGWTADASGVQVTTPRGVRHAGRLVVTAGAWVARLFPELALPFRVERQVLHWFAPAGDAEQFRPDRCPVHLWQVDGSHFFYGFPLWGEGVKVARHHDGQTTDPDQVDREVHAAEVSDMRAFVRRFLPAADGPVCQSVVCLYTNTPDGHFWIDQHPAHSRVLITSPCSGHGFKFASVVGEIVSAWAVGAGDRFDLRLFRARSFVAR